MVQKCQKLNSRNIDFSVSHNMTSVKDGLCLVIDLKGFFVQKKFQIREMSYYSTNEQFGRHAFFMPKAFNNLSTKRQKDCKLCKIQNPSIEVSTDGMTGKELRTRNKKRLSLTIVTQVQDQGKNYGGILGCGINPM